MAPGRCERASEKKATNNHVGVRAPDYADAHSGKSVALFCQKLDRLAGKKKIFSFPAWQMNERVPALIRRVAHISCRLIKN
jgi:hypothetical protein